MATALQSPAPPQDLFSSFQARAEAVSARVRRVPDLRAAVEAVLELLVQEGVSAAPGCHAVWAPSPCLEGLPTSRLVEAGVRFDVSLETATSARLGITQVDAAVADTGSVVLASAAPEQRLASSLPPAHVALVPARDVLPDLAAVLRRFPPRDLPLVTLITGPSRTADIERVLTIGVHGPARLHLLCVDELPARR